MKKAKMTVEITTKSEWQQGRLYYILEKFNIRLIERKPRSMVYETNMTLSKGVKIIKALQKENVSFIIKRSEA